MASRGVGPAARQDRLRVVPANQTPWHDIEQVLGKARCHGGLCYCLRFKLGSSSWTVMPDEERAHRLREQTDCRHAESGSTSGLLAYADSEPVGWCNVEPPTAFPYLPAELDRLVRAAAGSTPPFRITLGEPFYVGSPAGGGVPARSQPRRQHRRIPGQGSAASAGDQLRGPRHHRAPADL